MNFFKLNFEYFGSYLEIYIIDTNFVFQNFKMQ